MVPELFGIQRGRFICSYCHANNLTRSGNSAPWIRRQRSQTRGRIAQRPSFFISLLFPSYIFLLIIPTFTLLVYQRVNRKKGSQFLTSFYSKLPILHVKSYSLLCLVPLLEPSSISLPDTLRSTSGRLSHAFFPFQIYAYPAQTPLALLWDHLSRQKHTSGGCLPGANVFLIDVGRGGVDCQVGSLFWFWRQFFALFVSTLPLK